MYTTVHYYTTRKCVRGYLQNVADGKNQYHTQKKLKKYLKMRRDVRFLINSHLLRLIKPRAASKYSSCFRSRTIYTVASTAPTFHLYQRTRLLPGFSR